MIYQGVCQVGEFALPLEKSGNLNKKKGIVVKSRSRNLLYSKLKKKYLNFDISTSIIGKRFEHITSQELLVAINNDVLYENQFA